MRILFLSSEVMPFAKTGGLADVAGALPIELTRIGHEIIVVMPRYKKVDINKYKLKQVVTDINVKVGDKNITGAAYIGKIPNSRTKIYFIENNDLFEREGLYGTNECEYKDYKDNSERFIFYSKAALELCKKLDWSPDIVHCNDWQTGVVPLLLKTLYKNDPLFKNSKSLFTIHNLAYQGIFDKEVIEQIGVSWDYFSFDKLEFWGKLSFLKGALIYADAINTVSIRYSKEIQTEEYGAGLDGVLQDRKKDLYGILNGIDYNFFNPMKDPNLHNNYNSRTLYHKEGNKEFLLRQLGLKYKKGVPLVSMITRLADQKGFDIFSEIAEKLFSLDIQLVVLGTGMDKYHKLLLKLEMEYPQKMKALLSYDPVLAQQIYAGSDIFLMPSHYEPCGLGQLISLKYGTIPVVRETGGLADTIVDFDLARDFEQDRGNGFTFSEYSSKNFFNTIIRSLKVYKDKNAWSKIQANAMKADFSWKVSARTYENLYKKISEKN